MQRLPLSELTVCSLWLVSVLALAQEPPTDSARAPVEPRLLPDLSPASAARGALKQQEEAEGPTASAPDVSEADLTERIPGLVRASRASVLEKTERAVEDVTWRVLTPWRQPKESGHVRYWFIGHTFDASILDDGSVQFRPKQGVTLSPVAVTTAAGALPNGRDGSGSDQRNVGGPGAWGVGVGVAQPGRVSERLVTGKEPPNEEAHRFMEQTRPLRERLLAVAHAADLARADKKMTQALARLWNAPIASTEQRKQTFALWDECSDDETGNRARAQIEAFLHERETARGACPFAPMELAQLNEKRRSKQLFAPCSQHPAQPGVDGSRAGP